MRQVALRVPAFYCCLFYLFLRFSYLHEKLPGITGLALLAAIIAFPMLIVTGAIPFTLRDRRSWPWIGFVLWFAFAIPFSAWKGGSISDLFSYLRVEFPVLFMAAGLAVSWKDVRKLIGLLAISGAFNVLYSLFAARSGVSRLELDSMSSIGNANDFAAHLIFLAPALLYYAIRPKSSIIMRLSCLGLCALMAQQVVNTGSRGNLIALVVMVTFFFFRGTGKQKAITLAFCVVGAAAVLSFTKASILERLSNFSTTGAAATDEAAASRTAREYLVRRSIEYSLQYPLFGVGPGQFSVYEGGMQVGQGKRGHWQVTHNTYTQVSSECGIPALLFYLFAIWKAFSTFNGIAKQAARRQDGERRAAAICAMTAMVGFGVAIMFLSLAYRSYFPMMTGLAIAMWHVLNAEGFWQSTQGVAAPRPLAGFASRPIPTL